MAVQYLARRMLMDACLKLDTMGHMSLWTLVGAIGYGKQTLSAPVITA